MSVSSLQGLVAAGFAKQNADKANSKLQATVAALSSGRRLNQAAEDVAALSVAVKLQSQVSALKQASQNVAQASSTLQVADGGLDQIGQMLDRMKALATQANSGALSDSAREGINKEFQALAEEVNRVAENTNFNGVKLLDGSASGDGALKFQIGEDSSDVVELSVDDARTAALFGGEEVDLLSADASSNALDVVSTAINKVISNRAEVGSNLQALDILGAGIETAIQNQEAARSVLQDTDFASASTDYAQQQVQQQASLALLAQTNKMPGNLLKLLVS